MLQAKRRAATEKGVDYGGSDSGLRSSARSRVARPDSGWQSRVKDKTTAPRKRPLGAVGLLLIGAGCAAAYAQSAGSGRGLSGDALLSLGLAALQLGIAISLWLRLPGARVVSLVAFAFHWLVLALAGFVVLVIYVLPFLGSGSGLNPVMFGALAAVALGTALVYGAAIRSMLQAG